MQPSYRPAGGRFPRSLATGRGAATRRHARRPNAVAYFDIPDSTYTLPPSGHESTELNIRMRYRVSTQFNCYADAVRLLIGIFEELILESYSARAIQG